LVVREQATASELMEASHSGPRRYCMLRCSRALADDAGRQGDRVPVAVASDRSSLSPGSGVIPILMYHEVARSEDIADVSRITQRNYVVTVEAFRAHLDAIAASGCHTVSLDQFAAWQRDSAALPANPVVITFDDGFEGNLNHAAPLLAERGMSATVFVVTDWVGRPGMMSWAQLREARAAGIDIQSHTASHAMLSTLTATETSAELESSRIALEQALGSRVAHVALPHGDWNAHYSAAAQAAGYLSGCSSLVGRNDRTTDPFFLRRVAVTHKLSADTIGRLATGDRALFGRMERTAGVKRAISRVLGKRLYRRLVDYAYGVQQPTGTDP
jgi:peptidoglycan/xylan/chitin deacetylase (PgdA/CDA1 family)